MTDLIAVEDGYHHVAKWAVPGPLLSAGSSRLKWYDIARPQTPVPSGVRDNARSYLVARAGQRQLELDCDVGFAVLHRCGADNDFYFLPVCTWRNSNEMWQSVYYKDAAMNDFAPFPQSGRHKGTLCVWELGPVIHEQLAWVSYLKSPRGEADLNAYLSSAYAGEVAG